MSALAEIRKFGGDKQDEDENEDGERDVVGLMSDVDVEKGLEIVFGGEDGHEDDGNGGCNGEKVTEMVMNEEELWPGQ